MKTVAIIGGGVAGLIAIKTCLEEELEPTCYEKTPTFGGLWKYRDQVIHGVASVMKSTIINTSKEISAFSDFPPPREFANYMPHDKVFEYFKMYAEKFNLEPYITYNTEVIRVEKHGDDKPAKWLVLIRNLESQAISAKVFDAVMVCIGHHVFPHIPKFRCQSDFQGQIIHSHDYKTYTGMENKRAVVVGIGNSGLDVAVELSRVCSQAYLVTRRGAWIVSRVSDGGLPFDFSINRFAALIQKILPFSVNSYLAEKAISSSSNHELFCLKPKHGPLSQHPSMSDEIFNRIACGSVIVKPDIYKLTNKGIIFEDATEINDIDIIVLCTGYDIKFPFLEESIIFPWQNNVNLYQYVFPPNVKMSTLAIIGLVQAIGPVMPVAEIQSRWATRVFKGLAKLPSEEEMEADIKAKKEAIAKRFVGSQRHTIETDLIPYLDSIASNINVKPSLFQTALNDIDLFFAIFFGPAFPYQYRLTGPGKWPGARDAILSAVDRVYYPLKTRSAKETHFYVFSILLTTALIAFLLVSIVKIL